MKSCTNVCFPLDISTCYKQRLSRNRGKLNFPILHRKATFHIQSEHEAGPVSNRFSVKVIFEKIASFRSEIAEMVIMAVFLLEMKARRPPGKIPRSPILSSEPNYDGKALRICIHQKHSHCI